MTRGEYNTRQKRELLAFLKERSMQHFSVDEVVFELRDRGEHIGRSTVYRYLEQLAEQGEQRTAIKIEAHVENPFLSLGRHPKSQGQFYLTRTVGKINPQI